MTKNIEWQYLIVPLTGGIQLEDVNAMLDMHGAEGWEYVSPLVAANVALLIFKRVKPLIAEPTLLERNAIKHGIRN